MLVKGATGDFVSGGVLIQSKLYSPPRRGPYIPWWRPDIETFFHISDPYGGNTLVIGAFPTEMGSNLISVAISLRNLLNKHSISRIYGMRGRPYDDALMMLPFEGWIFILQKSRWILQTHDVNQLNKLYSTTSAGKWSRKYCKFKFDCALADGCVSSLC